MLTVLLQTAFLLGRAGGCVLLTWRQAGLGALSGLLFGAWEYRPSASLAWPGQTETRAWCVYSLGALLVHCKAETACYSKQSDFFNIKMVAVLKQLGNPLCPLGWTGLGLETSPL